jgi:esterase/lipase
MEKVNSRLSMIGMPSLVIQSKGDPVVDPRGSKELFEKIGSTEKSYRTFDMNRHGILLGEGSDAVHAVIGEFCKRVVKSLPIRQ